MPNRKSKKKHLKLEAIIKNTPTAKMMNDECKYLFECRDATFEMNCFGLYRKCIRYNMEDLTLPVKGWDWYINK